MASMARDIQSEGNGSRIWVNLLFEGDDAARLIRQRDRRHLKTNTTFVRQVFMERLDQLEAEQPAAELATSSAEAAVVLEVSAS